MKLRQRLGHEALKKRWREIYDGKEQVEALDEFKSQGTPRTSGFVGHVRAKKHVGPASRV